MLTRRNEHQMYRETLVSRLSTMRETGVSRYIFRGERDMRPQISQMMGKSESSAATYILKK